MGINKKLFSSSKVRIYSKILVVVFWFSRVLLIFNVEVFMPTSKGMNVLGDTQNETKTHSTD